MLVYLCVSVALCSYISMLQPTDVHHGYASRHLAVGLCDPPVALRMDVDIPAKTQPKTPRQEEHRKQ